tara:strand:+ start:1405 stop:1941 length:537 start_codon:yes stop_codon:yes gene_type:complete
MNNNHIISSLNKELDELEAKIEELSNKYLDLKKENQLLKERQEHEVAEKFKIKEKNQKVQNKVEGIIKQVKIFGIYSTMNEQDKKKPVTVKILNQNYDIFCQEDEKDDLFKSAELLNDKMMKTKAEGKTIGLDRIAVISALNFANDSLSHKDITNSLNSSIKDRISKLHQKIDSILQN